MGLVAAAKALTQTGLVFPHQSQLLGLDVEEALVIRAATIRGLGRLENQFFVLSLCTCTCALAVLGHLNCVVPLGLGSSCQS